jgi:hypothetical protein
MRYRISCAAFVSALVCSSASAQFLNRPLALRAIRTANYQSFNQDTGTYDLTMPMLYQLPDSRQYGPGPYPVFIWTPGTYETAVDPLSLRFVSEMANRGFLAAAVQYSNTELAQTCTAYTQRALGVFDAGRATSAVSAICALSTANCAKGIVTSGISQGGILAILARNYAPAVKAVYALSTGAENEAGVGVDLSACMGKSKTLIPADRLTIVNGHADPSFGSQSATQNASGFTCPDGSVQCWSPTGSGAGWYLVQNSQVADGSADHCYIDVGGCNDRFDASWLPPASYNWSLKSNLDWLATFGTHRVFSANGQ